MKRILLTVGLALLLVACGSDETTTEEQPRDQAEETNVVEVDETEEAEEVVEEQPAEGPEEESTGEIEVTDELAFGEFTVKMNGVNVYEEDGKHYADISFSWLNQSGDGDKTFMSIALLDVKQGDTILDETTGAWDVMNQNTSDVYFPNADGGEKTVELTYELDNAEDLLTIIFTPLNDVVDEDSQEVTIDIK